MATLGLPGSGLSTSTWLTRRSQRLAVRRQDHEQSVRQHHVAPSASRADAVDRVEPRFAEQADACFVDVLNRLEIYEARREDQLAADPWRWSPDDFDWRAAVPPRLASVSILRGVITGGEKLVDPRYEAIGISHRNREVLERILGGDSAVIHQQIRSAVFGLNAPFSFDMAFCVAGQGDEIRMVVTVPSEAWRRAGTSCMHMLTGLGIAIAAAVSALCVAPSAKRVALGVFCECQDAASNALLANIVVDRSTAEFLVRGRQPLNEALLRTMGQLASVANGIPVALPVPSWIREIHGAG